MEFSRSWRVASCACRASVFVAISWGRGGGVGVFLVSSGGVLSCGCVSF
ncbi:hypothetical protein HMPREF1869_00452 [Bacteroidales bacterium KA00251]|nr:hypothetical protein HMPREF1869_00452 [Bacteroidales bacterium KA00251]